MREAHADEVITTNKGARQVIGTSSDLTFPAGGNGKIRAIIAGNTRPDQPLWLIVDIFREGRKALSFRLDEEAMRSIATDLVRELEHADSGKLRWDNYDHS